jgi:hypothetical protein
VAIAFRDYVGLPDDERSQLARILTRHQDLMDVFAWGRLQTPPIQPADLVKQDEFTHDVLVPYTRGRWLVLDRRLEAGWRPKPSLLRAGDRVEGFAACLFQAPEDPT